MDRRRVVAVAVVGGVLVGLVALAAPAVAIVAADLTKPSPPDAAASSTTAADATPTPDPTGLPDGYVDLGGVAVPAGGPGDCTTTSWLDARKEDGQPGHLTLLGPPLIDTGPREFAQGTPHLDDQGRIATYTVAPGDAPWAIGDRFCIGNGMALGSVNHTSSIHPGDVIYLTPDPTIVWIPYEAPFDAPAGFAEQPYEGALEDMGEASVAGDVDAMREIWNDRLAAMITDPTDLAALTQALDGGDLRVLRQVFP